MIYLKLRQAGYLVNHKCVKHAIRAGEIAGPSPTSDEDQASDRLPLIRPGAANEVSAIGGRPSIIRTDNGREFSGRTMLTRTYRHSVALRLSNPASPTRASTLNRSMGWLRDESVNEHWGTGQYQRALV